jgi:hypothetical protein
MQVVADQARLLREEVDACQGLHQKLLAEHSNHEDELHRLQQALVQGQGKGRCFLAAGRVLIAPILLRVAVSRPEREMELKEEAKELASSLSTRSLELDTSQASLATCKAEVAQLAVALQTLQKQHVGLEGNSGALFLRAGAEGRWRGGWVRG